MLAQTPLTGSLLTKRIFMSVGPVRITGYAMLSAALANRPVTPERLAEETGRIDEAVDMLKLGAEAVIDEAGEAMPPELDELRRKALAAVLKMRSVIAEARGEAPALTRLTPQLAEEVERSVTAFMFALSDLADQLEAAKIKRDQDAIRAAVAEIRTISASINLISINAAIEAARAGEAGHGFGVIAAEIRNLSAQSQQSLDAIVASVEKI